MAVEGDGRVEEHIMSEEEHTLAKASNERNQGKVASGPTNASSGEVAPG